MKTRVPQGRQCNHPTCGDTCRRVKQKKQRTPLKRGTKRLRKCTPKLQAERRQYAILRRDYLMEHPWCCVHGCGKRATDVHHARGRGKYLLAVKYFRGMCRTHHDYYEEHVTEAKAAGYSDSRLSKT